MTLQKSNYKDVFLAEPRKMILIFVTFRIIPTCIWFWSLFWEVKCSLIYDVLEDSGNWKCVSENVFLKGGSL